MRIGFDVSQTGPKKAGCGFYADGLIRALAACDPANEYLLYPSFGDHFFDPDFDASRLPSARNVRVAMRSQSHAEAARFWRMPDDEIERQLGSPDLVHANNYYAPLQLRRAKLVYTLYDLSFLENHTWTTEANRTACFSGVLQASICADWLVAISEYSKSRFLEVFPYYPRDRITVVYPASRFSDAHPATIPKRGERLQRREFWLAVGTLEPRKNYLAILRAYAEFRRRGHGAFPLAVAGGAGWLMKGIESEIEALQLKDCVILLGYVDDAELCWLYRNARCLVYPSLYEGFGMPVLEAMSCGTPAIASHGSAFREILAEGFADGHSLLVHPLETNSITAAMELLSSMSATALDRLGNMAKAVAHAFTWSGSAKSLLDTYRTIHSLPKLFN